ncbi:hypothetical protein M9458_055198 [Cirrhinus mrigala]|uniref:Immunoglobulin V-set domain-containing protein n=1 Tax=Cirrhinus mrigala TaxID=683832 RepID=A0ABD0MIG1_CIRMR
MVDVTSGLDFVAVMEGDSITLSTGITKQQRDKMLWYFNNTLIALINGESSKSCLYDGEGGIFRDRLEVDYATGSLTVTNITPEHTGRYEANFIQSKSSGTSQSLNRNSKCDSTKVTRKISNMGNTIKTLIVSVTDSVLSLGLAGICAGVGVALLVATAVAAVIYCRHKSSKMGKYQLL